MNHCGPKESILNIIQQMLCYDDGVVTDNPHQRAFDWRMRLENIPCKNPFGSEMTLAPGQTASIFSSVITTGLVPTTSVLDLDFVSPSESVYRLTVASGPFAFKTPRTVTFTGTPEQGTITALADISSSVVTSKNSVAGAPHNPLSVGTTPFTTGVQTPGLNAVAEQGTITCLGDVSFSLNSSFFFIGSPTVKYYVWFNVSGAGTDPAFAGMTGIHVPIADNSSPMIVAQAVAAQLNSSGAFTAAATGANVNYTDTVAGATLQALSPGNSGFTTVTTTTGVTAQQEVDTIECVADVSSSLNNTYFFISSPTVDYYVWFNIGGAGTDPAIPGRTGIEVSVAVNASVILVSSAVAAALTAVTGVFVATSSLVNNTYFFIASPTVKYYVWFNVGGAGTDPALTGMTGIMVSIAPNSSATAVAAAISAALAALTSVFTSSSSLAVASYTDVVGGATLAPLAPGNTGYAVATTVIGLAPGSNASVTINNNAVANFTFPNANLTAIQPGDVMRINGQVGFDTAPYAFNPLNAGTWIVASVAGQTVMATRPTGIGFQAAQENPVTPVANDVIFFANDMVQAGMMFQITGTFSPVTQRTYQVLEATPYFIQFVSTQPIPVQDAVPYVANTLTMYDGVKKMVYVEVDQECSIQYNGQTDSLNRIVPIKPADRYLKGYANKWGDTFSCNVTNQSVNSCRVKFLTVE
jgi:hypothetical protein